MEKVLSELKKVFLIGIGGTGMSGLALLLRDKGIETLGSDQKSSNLTALLKEKGLKVTLGHNRDNISDDIDLVVYSSAVADDNPQILEAKNKDIPIIKRGELLAFLSNQKQTIAVSGSHGKTTTTALLSYLLQSLGLRPTVFVGGLPLNYSCGAWWGDDFFVVETDESDGSFLNFTPDISIITNIDNEHLDHYGSMDNLKQSFMKFASQTKKLVIGCSDQPEVLDIVQSSKGLSYGYDSINSVRAKNYSYNGECSCFDLFIDKEFILKVQVPLVGSFNCLNTLAALSVLHFLGKDLIKANQALKFFKGTKRRFQKKGKFAGILFVDDYAHHPTEIKSVIEASRLLQPKRLVVVIQPHRYSRLRLLKREFSNCFEGADLVILTDVYGASEQNLSKVNTQELFEEAKSHFSGKIVLIPKAELCKKVPPLLVKGDLVLSLGAGDINILMEGIIDEFKKVRII